VNGSIIIHTNIEQINQVSKTRTKVSGCKRYYTQVDITGNQHLCIRTAWSFNHIWLHQAF